MRDRPPLNTLFDFVSPCCESDYLIGIACRNESEYLELKRMFDKECPSMTVYNCLKCNRHFFFRTMKFKSKPL